MRAAAWLVDTVAISSNRLRGIIRAVVLRRAQNHNSSASKAALKPAAKNLALIRSRKCKSLSPSNAALERITVNSSEAIRETAAQRIPRRQKASTETEARAGRAIASKYAM